jgi:FSR family fosmidomycin resistance protein-like MFS transporter
MTSTARAEPTVLPILAGVTTGHLPNDLMQSLIPAIYPILKGELALSFAQVGLITMVFQGTASILQPLIGLGSAIFHPESSRIARLAAGARPGFAQSLFQVGGNAGSAIGPLAAALIVLPRGQSSVAWFAAVAMPGLVILSLVGRWLRSKARRALSPASAAC